MKRNTNIPWLAVCALYAAGIAMIFIRSEALESDTARLIALGMQFILAGGMVHGVAKMTGVIKEAAKLRGNRIDLPKVDE